MYLPLISFLTELWRLLDVSAVVGHGAVHAGLLLSIHDMIMLVSCFYFKKPEDNELVPLNSDTVFSDQQTETAIRAMTLI